MGKATYSAISCRSALNRVQGMPFRWSLNPYRGCEHSCKYCYARATHKYFELGVGRDFEEIIFYKENLPEVLRGELQRARWAHESIAIGTATDPYQPAEGRFRITRRCLEVLAAAANPCSITTKGTLIVRDLDVLQSLTAVTQVSVHMSLITRDRDLWRRIEPGAPSPENRLRTISRLRAAGVPVTVFMMPVLPGLTDGQQQMSDLIKAAAEHGASGVATTGLRLAPDIRNWFIDFIRAEFPDLTADYESWYGRKSNLPGEYLTQLSERAKALVRETTFTPRPERRDPDRVGRQFMLFPSSGGSD
jgi:DNA repair photolyase